MVRGGVMESAGWPEGTWGLQAPTEVRPWSLAWALQLSSPVTTCRHVGHCVAENNNRHNPGQYLNVWHYTVAVCFQRKWETRPVTIPHPPPFPTLAHKGSLMVSESSAVWKSLSVFLLALLFTPTPHLPPQSAHCPLPPLQRSHLGPFPLSLPSPHPAAGLGPLPSGVVLLWTFRVLVTCMCALPPWVRYEVPWKQWWCFTYLCPRGHASLPGPVPAWGVLTGKFNEGNWIDWIV